MAEIAKLKDAVNIKTTNFVLLTIVTASIYPVIWVFINTPKIEAITSKKIASDTFLIWLAVCVGLSGAFANLDEEALDIISGVLVLASWVLYVIWAFRTKKVLQEYALTEHRVDLKMNAFYTFLFDVYYINYCINDLPESQRKQQILNGSTEPQEN